jgi:hypothetical protein
MAAPRVTPSLIPTGGAIALSVSGAASGTAILSRAVSGQAFSQIYSGQPVSYYLDIGDGLPGPLNPASLYQYQYQDENGTTTTPFIQPAVELKVSVEPLLEIMIRLTQATINSLTLPSGVKKPQVTNAMPMGGQIPLPLVVINEDLTQQAAVPIGQSVPMQPPQAAILAGSASSGYTITGFANRIFRLSVLADNVLTRDFFKMAFIGMFEAIYGPVLQPLGLDVTHKWQVSTGQVANDKTGMGPGFYFSEAILQFEGTLNVGIYPPTGLIETIQTTVTSDNAVDVITVPVSGT